MAEGRVKEAFPRPGKRGNDFLRLGGVSKPCPPDARFDETSVVKEPIDPFRGRPR